MTVSEIAARDGVSVPAISKMVAHLRSLGLSVQLTPGGRVKAVAVVEYDRLRAQYGTPERQQAPAQQITNLVVADSLEEAKRQRAVYDAESARLDLGERRAQLVRRDRLIDAATVVAAEINRIVESIAQDADDIAAAVARDGAPGARRILQQTAHRLRLDITRTLDQLASAASPLDDQLEHQTTLQ